MNLIQKLKWQVADFIEYRSRKFAADYLNSHWLSLRGNLAIVHYTWDGGVVDKGIVSRAKVTTEFVNFKGNINKMKSVVLTGILGLRGAVRKSGWGRIIEAVSTWTARAKSSLTWTNITADTTTWTDEENEDTEWTDE